ncbi:MAG: hypothetical protein WA756_06565 [Pseudolabrys sp.]|jgi:hypothetical protein
MPEQTSQGRIVETAKEARAGERGPSMVVVLTVSTLQRHEVPETHKNYRHAHSRRWIGSRKTAGEKLKLDPVEPNLSKTNFWRERRGAQL